MRKESRYNSKDGKFRYLPNCRSMERIALLPFSLFSLFTEAVILWQYTSSLFIPSYLRGEKRVYPLFGFHRDFGSDGIVTNQGILHIAEKTLFVQADQEEKDIVFLDIEMPGMNGIYVGNELKKANKNVLIFVITSTQIDQKQVLNVV